MDVSEISPNDAEYLFPRSKSRGTNATLWFLGGCGGIGMGGMAFALLLVIDISLWLFVCITVLPICVGIQAIAVSWALSRTPRLVRVGPQGIRIERKSGSQFYSWEEIGGSAVGPMLLRTPGQLVIFDTQGKTIAKLGNGFQHYDMLIDVVTRRIREKDDSTSERIRSRRDKRSALFVAGVGVAFLALAGTDARMAHSQQRAAKLLATTGVRGEARVQRRYLAPDGRTPRVEYRITTPEGRSATRDAEVTRAYWDELQEADIVSVVFVPREPEINRLANGEPDDDFMDSPIVSYVEDVLFASFSCGILAVAVLTLLGWDVSRNSETRKISIKRYGTGRRGP